MAHYLTFNSYVTCTVNGTSVSSGYELHDGDVIVANSTLSRDFWINQEHYYDGATVDIYDLDVDVAGGSGGSND